MVLFFFLQKEKKNSLKNKISIDFHLVAVGIAFLFLLPTGIVQAVTNQSIGKLNVEKQNFDFSLRRFLFYLGLNVITEFVAGVAIPGDPLANVTFKTYGYITQYQALLLISDLKLGHYMKVS